MTGPGSQDHGSRHCLHLLLYSSPLQFPTSHLSLMLFFALIMDKSFFSWTVEWSQTIQNHSHLITWMIDEWWDQIIKSDEIKHWNFPHPCLSFDIHLTFHSFPDPYNFPFFLYIPSSLNFRPLTTVTGWAVMERGSNKLGGIGEQIIPSSGSRHFMPHHSDLILPSPQDIIITLQCRNYILKLNLIQFFSFSH